MSFSTSKTMIISSIVFLLYSLPWILLNENSYILIHDNLESNLVWFKTLIQSNMLFVGNYVQVPMLMDAPRVSLGSEFNLQLFFYYFFEPYNAYVTNQIIIRIIAFFGMYLLTYNYIFKKEYQQYSILMALTYSLLPFWPSGGLSVAGLPLITYVFLNLYNHNSTPKEWLTIIIFPFYSSFVLSMIFYIFFLGLFWINSLRLKKSNIYFTTAIFLFIGMYILTNYRLFEAFLFSSDFVSHRVERVSEYKTIFESILSSIKHFIGGQYHAHSLHVIFLPLVLFVFIHARLTNNINRIFELLFFLNISISIWYGFWKFEGWESIKESVTILNSLNLSRFHFLTPILWYILFAFSIKYFLENINMRNKNLIILFLVVLQIIFLFLKSDFVQTYKKEHITYKEFYSKNLFNDVNSFINKNKNKYKVVSIGIHPAIARYNGFYTADGYLANYSLEYKKRFRKIIEKELEKSNKLKKSFDNWGNRCYLFVNEVGYNFTRIKDMTKPINIDIDTDGLKDLSVEYIFSSYKIKNFEENNLELLKLFQDQDSAWDIYLYKIKEKK